jgi:hypothetical protein
MLNENEKGTFHLSNGLRLSYKNNTLLKELFPVVWERKTLQDYIALHKKSE